MGRLQNYQERWWWKSRVKAMTALPDAFWHMVLDEPRRQPPTLMKPQAHEADIIASSDDSQLAMLNYDRHPASLLLGVSHKSFLWADKFTNLLHIGPQQTPLGKTASGTVPNGLVYNGPLVVVTTKGRVAPALAMARARMGNVYGLDVDGKGLNPGYKALKYNVLEEIRRSAAEPEDRYTFARDIASGTVKASTTEDIRRSDAGEYWQQRAMFLLAALLFGCAETDRDMTDLMDLVAGFDSEKGRDDIRGIVDELEDLGIVRIARALEYQTTPHGDGRDVHNALATVQNAMAAYERRAVMALTQSNNGFFHAAEFVRGRDTIIIESETPDEVAPLIVMFLSSIRKAAADMMRDADSSTQRMETTPQPTLFLLDELATMAPLPNLAIDIAKGRTGVLYFGAAQSPKQLKRFGDPSSMLSYFQNLVIHPGIRDAEVLRMLSELAGQLEFRRETESSSRTFDDRGDSVSKQEHFEKIPKLTIEMIANGHPTRPDARLIFRHGATKPEWVIATPYFYAPPFPKILTDAFCFWSQRTEARAWKLPPPELRSEGKMMPSLTDDVKHRYMLALTHWRLDHEGGGRGD